MSKESLHKQKADALPSEQQFVTHFEPYIRNIANKIRLQMSLRVEMDDLVAWGFEGLIDARTRFDPTRGVQFKTYAYYRVRGSIIDGLRNIGWLPRNTHYKLKALDAANQLMQQLSVEQGISRGAKHRKEEVLETLHQAVQQVTAAYLISSLGQSQEYQEPETPEQSMIRMQSKDRIMNLMHILPDRQQLIVRGFYFERRTLDDLANELGISRSWASRLHAKALFRLKNAISKDEI